MDWRQFTVPFFHLESNGACATVRQSRRHTEEAWASRCMASTRIPEKEKRVPSHTCQRSWSGSASSDADLSRLIRGTCRDRIVSHTSQNETLAHLAIRADPLYWNSILYGVTLIVFIANIIHPSEPMLSPEDTDVEVNQLPPNSLLARQETQLHSPTSQIAAARPARPRSIPPAAVAPPAAHVQSTPAAANDEQTETPSNSAPQPHEWS